MTADHDEDSSKPQPPGDSGRLRTAMAAVLVLLLIAAVAAGVWGYTRLKSTDAQLDSRADVARVAEQFTVAVNNYDTASADKYQSRISALLSTKFRTDFDSAMKDIVARIQGTKMKSQGKVLASGVASLDNDSARVLVVADADVTTSYDQQGLQRHFRWEVSLVKVDGKWLVDDFRPVA